MKCCRQDVTSVELQVAGQPFVMHRCGDCGTNYWTHDGRFVPLAEVTAAMERASEAKAAERAARAAR